MMGGSSGGSRLNRGMVWVFVAIGFLGPLPLGSNRPVAWAFWAMVIGLGLALHIALSGGADDVRSKERGKDRAALAGRGVILGLGLVQRFWGLVQLIPGLGGLLGGLAVLPVGAVGEIGDGLAASTITLSRDATGLAVLRMLSHVALFVLVVRVVGRASLADLLLRGLFFGITLHAVWAMVNLAFLGDWVIWGEKSAYLGAATGPFVNRNSFASYLGMGLVLAVVLVMDQDHVPRLRTPQRWAIFAPDNLARAGIGLCGLLILVALLATQSRAGLAASLIGAGVAGLVMGRARSRHSALLARPQLRLARGILGVIAGSGLLAVLGQAVAERGLFTLADAGGRGEIYANAVARIGERPRLGYGLDTFAMAYELGGSGGGVRAVIQVDAHSTYLENWVEGGVIFGSAMILAGLLYLRRLRRVAGGLLGGAVHVQRDDAGPAAAPLATPPAAPTAEPPAQPPALVAASLGVLVLAGLHALVDFSFEIGANVMVLTMILALGVTPLRRRLRQDPVRQDPVRQEPVRQG